MTVHTLDRTSSMFGRVYYDDERQTLVVHMHHGGVYTTPGVSQAEWRALKDAPSPGRWWQENIRGR